MLGLYKTILADPPWDIKLIGKRGAINKMPYPTMPLQEIKQLPVSEMAADGCHLWLWTTNQTLRDGFDVMESWGFKYLAPIVWIKKGGLGFYFTNVTQILLFGYKGRCNFPLKRYMPNIIHANQRRHSEKPAVVHDYVETISPGPRVELFARRHRLGWDTWGNEVYKTAVFLDRLDGSI